MTESDTSKGYLSSRERALIIATGTLMFVLGMWVGLFLVPAEALAYPITGTDTTGDGITYEKYFHPVPTYLPLLTVIIVLAGLYAAYTQVRPENEETDFDDQTGVTVDD